MLIWRSNFMSDKVKPKKFSYGAGAFAVLIISLGVAILFYGGGLLTFEPLGLVAWLLSPLGAYTIIYAFKAGKDAFYYMSWGLIIFAAGIASALYKMVNVIIILGVLLIVLAVMGLAVYWRKK
jgi:hypothetical protein